MLLAVVITAASVQDRDAARPLLWNLTGNHLHVIGRAVADPGLVR